MTWPGNPAGWLTPEEWQAVRLSLEVALRSVVFGLPPAVLAAWLLARHRFPGRALLDAFVHLPLVMPPVVVGWLLLVLFALGTNIGIRQVVATGEHGETEAALRHVRRH